MTICRQLNYLRTACRYSNDYKERLVADGELGGRNWSYIERTWLRDVRWRGGKTHYILRVDVSEHAENYRKLIYDSGWTHDMIAAMLQVPLPGDAFPKAARFHVSNQSPGLWENGFNPNYWLEAELGAYRDEEDRLRRIVETGLDLGDSAYLAQAVPAVVENITPFIEVLAAQGRTLTPYHYWWGVEEPPPPRKPVY